MARQHIVCYTNIKTVTVEKFTVGIFHVRKFHVKIFSSSWVNYSHLLPYLCNSKNILCVRNFHPSRLQMKIF